MTPQRSLLQLWWATRVLKMPILMTCRSSRGSNQLVNHLKTTEGKKFNNLLSCQSLIQFRDSDPKSKLRHSAPTHWFTVSKCNRTSLKMLVLAMLVSKKILNQVHSLLPCSQVSKVQVMIQVICTRSQETRRSPISSSRIKWIKAWSCNRIKVCKVSSVSLASWRKRC